MTVKGTLIARGRVRKVGIVNGHVSVKEGGREDTHDVPLGEVPNYAVFMRLVDVSGANSAP